MVNEIGIKSSDYLNIFMKEVTKEVIEAVYEEEITHPLGHGKNQKSETGNIRNGYSINLNLNFPKNVHSNLTLVSDR